MARPDELDWGVAEDLRKLATAAEHDRGLAGDQLELAELQNVLAKARLALQFTRQYAAQHGLLIGECVAWNDLKKMLGCTGAIPDKHERYPGIEGR